MVKGTSVGPHGERVAAILREFRIVAGLLCSPRSYVRWRIIVQPVVMYLPSAPRILGVPGIVFAECRG